MAERGYEWGVRLLRVAEPLLARGGSKLARGVRGRRGTAEALEGWRRARPEGAPVAWFHAPSVGEGLMARAVMEALAEIRPGIEVLHTFFSPSAESLSGRMPAGLSAYLPWDVTADVRRALDVVEPSLLVFTKTEVWPVLTREAVGRGVPTALVAGTLPSDAGRLRWPGRAVLRPAFGRLSALGVISAEDGERFRTLGVPPGRIEVTGDPGVDSAWRRARAADPEAPHLRPFAADPRPTVVAGSTWPADEDVLAPALEAVRRDVADLRVVVAPHEPTPDHVRALEERFSEGGWEVARLSSIVERGGAGGADAVVVDSVGLLATLYGVGRVAFVGGGFHDHGLHSVLEPAAAGIPVVFGPRHGNARAAGELVARGAARVADGPETLADSLRIWLTDADAHRRDSAAASGYIEEHRGAAERSARLLDGLLDVR